MAKKKNSDDCVKRIFWIKKKTRKEELRGMKRYADRNMYTSSLFPQYIKACIIFQDSSHRDKVNGALGNGLVYYKLHKSQLVYRTNKRPTTSKDVVTLFSTI